ncbi:MAG: succinate dehydrogenase, cytochrome b556 subunit [Deltaproteobacteria bacterium]|nr:succinate dehydrogenase, cytochrome b556 subunit [Deltaproteobacteria bacterium]MBW2051765.1 succinate dehydrogenase, cytochrome b556 subunit [Deltaproteobacteria bacterium]MBW2140380.1 succinate dehydrogenase, cytochrome b556 subunit [Deltaproteobacteria bacterium]MBW2322365.1 succinate dehydrogenase, cytochrome b556 subunit [Deltaproteobacteria bacterium]
MKAYQPKRHYRWHPGFVVWVLHRLSGLGLAGYLILHIWVLSHLMRGEAEFKRVMDTFESPLIRLMEIGLLGLVLFHGLNGIRIVLMDYGPMANKESYVKYLAVTFIAIVVLFLIGGAAMLQTLLIN